MKRLSTSALFLCGAIFAAHGAFGQATTTLTVVKAQDYKQSGTAAPVQVTNPFSLTASAQAQGYTISSATFTPPGAAAINLVSSSTTLFGFTSIAFATAQTLNSTFPSGAYNFSVQPAGAGAGPITGSVTMPVADNYPAAPTLTNAAAQWFAGTLQFDPSGRFPITWTAPSANVTDIRIIVSDPTTGTVVFTTTTAPNATTVSLPANTFKAGVLYNGRLIFGATVTSPAGAVTSKASFNTLTNFTLGPVSGPPTLISPNSVAAVVNQPVGYQLIASTAANYTIDPKTLPPGLSFDPVSGIVYGTPTASGSPSAN